jgi:hypothetical protein
MITVVGSLNMDFVSGASTIQAGERCWECFRKIPAGWAGTRRCSGKDWAEVTMLGRSAKDDLGEELIRFLKKEEVKKRLHSEKGWDFNRVRFYRCREIRKQCDTVGLGAITHWPEGRGALSFLIEQSDVCGFR